MEAGELPKVERHGAVVAEGEPGARKLFWSEVAVAALLSLTACAAAWSAYKATLVRDDADSTSTQAIRVLNLASGYGLHADQLLTRNQTLFLEYQRALRAGHAGEAARIKRNLMRPELRRQVDWWRAQPPGKYPNPFQDENPYYKAPFLVAARQARELSTRLFGESDRITTEANRYELMSVILALGLFLLGIGAVLKALGFRLAIAAMGTVILVVVSGFLIWLGVRDVRFDCQKYLQQVEHACD
jgi:hypothetical protein